MLDLYAKIWEGQPLGDDEYVLCADETTQLQALRRCHPDLPDPPVRIRRSGSAGPDPPVRIRRSEFEYPPPRHAGV